MTDTSRLLIRQDRMWRSKKWRRRFEEECRIPPTAPHAGSEEWVAQRNRGEIERYNHMWFGWSRAHAIAMEARSGETEGLDPKGDSAGLQGIAHD